MSILSIVISKRNSLTNILKALLSSGTTSNVIIQLIFGRTRHLFGRNKEKIKEIIKDLLDMKDNLMTNKIMELRVEQLPYLWSLRPSSLPLLSTSCGDNSGFWSSKINISIVLQIKDRKSFVLTSYKVSNKSSQITNRFLYPIWACVDLPSPSMCSSNSHALSHFLQPGKLSSQRN